MAAGTVRSAVWVAFVPPTVRGPVNRDTIRTKEPAKRMMAIEECSGSGSAMKVVTYDRFAPIDVLRVGELERPVRVADIGCS